MTPKQHRRLKIAAFHVVFNVICYIGIEWLIGWGSPEDGGHYGRAALIGAAVGLLFAWWSGNVNDAPYPKNKKKPADAPYENR